MISEIKKSYQGWLIAKAKLLSPSHSIVTLYDEESAVDVADVLCRRRDGELVVMRDEYSCHSELSH